MKTPDLKSRRLLWIAVAAAFLMAIVIATFAFLPFGRAAENGHAGERTGTEAAHSEEEHAGEEDLIRLTSAELTEFGIDVQTARPGTLSMTKTFPGEVNVNQERYAHVVARVPGVAASVAASVGERVRAGEVLAILESRELAEATAAYLAARQHRELAEATFEREERLYEKEISPEREYLEAKQAFARARIEVRSARQQLRALGLSDAYIDGLPEASAARFRYPLSAPISGVVVERHLTRGEAVGAEAEAFEIADLSTVWVDLSIYQEDMDRVHEGQEVVVSAGGHTEQGTISYVRPIVGEDTRTAMARVVVPNPHGRWKPGMFVSGVVSMGSVEAPVVVPKSALQTVDGETVVFVKMPEGFAPRPVTVGEESKDRVAITEGLTAGEQYAVTGTFTLKAQLAKGTFEAGHSH